MQSSVYIAASLDGFIARSDGSIDWLSIVHGTGEDYGYGSFFESIDTVIIGRKTYETALGFAAWPYTGKRCIVMTHHPKSALHGEEFYTGQPEPLAARLSSEKTKRAYVDGGAVIRQFLAAGLVSDLTVSVIPILLGEGAPLFGSLGQEIPLKLRESKSFASGLVRLEYVVAR